MSTIEINKPCGRKVIYFCPATMINNVVQEVRHWAPHRSVVALGGQPKIARKFLLDTMTSHPEYVVVCNYEAWRKDKSLIDELISIEFDTCIIDEAHNIKDRKSQGYKGIKRILTETNSGNGIPFVFPMTGTPILNKPQELFSLLSLVDPTHFYNERYFLQDFCEQDYYTGKWGFKPGGLDSLAKKITNYYLRRTKEQAGIQLPPKTIQVHEIEIDEEAYPEQARVRKEMRTWGSIMLDPEQGKAITAAAQIAVYTRLRQIETWPAGIKIVEPKTKEVLLSVDVNESQKIDEVIRPNGDATEPSYETPEGLIPEIARHPENNTDGEAVVIFSQFKEPLKEIKRRLDEAGYRSVILDGDTPDHMRNEIAMDFDLKHTSDNASAKYDIVLAHYRVGGVGLNFTRATQMIILDEEWNPGKRDQAYDRIHRMGQEKPVTIHVLRAWFRPANTPVGTKGGIDTWLAAIVDAKEDLVQGFDTSMDNLAGMGYDALKSGLI